MKHQVPQWRGSLVSSVCWQNWLCQGSHLDSEHLFSISVWLWASLGHKLSKRHSWIEPDSLKWQAVGTAQWLHWLRPVYGLPLPALWLLKSVAVILLHESGLTLLHSPQQNKHSPPDASLSVPMSVRLSSFQNQDLQNVAIKETSTHNSWFSFWVPGTTFQALARSTERMSLCAFCCFDKIWTETNLGGDD